METAEQGLEGHPVVGEIVINVRKSFVTFRVI